MNLIQLQESAVAEIVNLPQNGPRSCHFGLSLLNRRARGVSKIRRGFVNAARRLGFSGEQIVQQWQDVKDMAVLEARAE